MKHFQNILFVLEGHEIPAEALKKAADLIRSAKADLSFLVLHPNFSKKLENMQSAFEDSVRHSIEEHFEKYDLPKDVQITFETKTPHFVSVIQHVLKKGHDLVIKAAENAHEKESKGFKSLDMSLLHKCPCPVWICRGLLNQNKPKILTAIDPFSEEPEGHDLSIKLLQIGESLATALKGENTVISCWELEYEDFLRHSPFGKMESSQVDALVLESEQSHKSALDKLVKEAKIDLSGNMRAEKGNPQDVIPSYVERENIDLVVMGTVARTGIPGFFIGNTAENILQNLSCSMFAAKPNGFTSPVKAH